MQITLEADYAIRIVLYLASAGIKKDAKTISETTGVSLRFSLKILRNLVGAGLVKSFKGVHGGYILAKPTDKISLKEIIEATAGPYLFSRCLNDDFVCSSENSFECGCRHVFNEISDLVNNKLASTTVAMLFCKEPK